MRKFSTSSACEGNKNYGGGEETTQRMFFGFQWISPVMRVIGCVYECVPPWNGTGESFSFSRCCLDRKERADLVRSCLVSYSVVSAYLMSARSLPLPARLLVAAELIGLLPGFSLCSVHRRLQKYVCSVRFCFE